MRPLLTNSKKNVVLIKYVDLIVVRFEDENDCRRVQDLI